MRNQAGRVRRYYNKNTFWMLLFGQGHGERVVHRPVWTGGARFRKEALHSVERMIAEAVLGERRTNCTAKQLLDLGCGVGGSALWLAARHPFSITGVTLSSFQVRTARRLALRRGLSDRCRFHVADFTQLPEIQGITGAYAIESFSHGYDPAAFFTQVANLLPSGGRLILCDDFIAADGQPGSNRRQACLSRFRDGWHLESLMTCEEVLGTAEQCGFHLVERRDLTPYLRPVPALMRRLQHLTGSMLRNSAWGASMVGGSALQICQQNSWTEYLFLVLEKL
jgi:cyclopropane fatty-acyl-phospholipid synthase-like methyltransferase